MTGQTTQDITPELMQRFFDSGRLGSLEIEIPDCRKISVDLANLFSHLTMDVESLEYQTKSEDVEAVCVYGSVLYKHFPQKTETVEQRSKKYWFLGPEQVSTRTITGPRKTPGDFDVMVITKQGLTDDKVIIPEQSVICDSYGFEVGVDSDEKSGVTTTVLEFDGYGYVIGSFRRGDLNLHIAYRSVEQFLNGLGRGDGLSESVVRYGIPVIGQERFRQITEGVDFPKREPLHEVQWAWGLEGRLQGKIQ